MSEWKRLLLASMLLVFVWSAALMAAAPVKFVFYDESGTLTGVYLKGSWKKDTGEYDPAWDGGATQQMYDDGTNGDEVAGDHRWTLIVDLVPDGGANTWEWGCEDQDHNWLFSANAQFYVIDNSPVTCSYPKTYVKFIFLDLGGSVTQAYLKGSWIKATGEYDAAWDGGATEPMYDDGTNGDEVAGDHVWTRIAELVPDGGANVWEWGVQDQDDNWLIEGPNPQFMVDNSMARDVRYPKMALATFVYQDTHATPYSNLELTGSWKKATGEYDAAWDGGAGQQMYDDGTNGDEVAGDHNWTRQVWLIVDNGENTWEWGALGDGSWALEGAPHNPRFKVESEKPILMSWPRVYVTFKYTDETGTLESVDLKGSWEKATGEYDAAWDGGATEPMYDDGTHGDLVAGDHIWTRTVLLIPDDGENTWEWGVQSGDTWLIDGPNPQFKLENSMAQVISYPPEGEKKAQITFVYRDTTESLSSVFLKGSWNKETGQFDSGWDGGATQQMYDDGTHGDLVAGDHEWTLTVELVVDAGMNIWSYGMEDGDGNWLISGDNPEFLLLTDEPQLLIYPRTPVPITFIIDDTKDGNYIDGCYLKGSWNKTTGEYDETWDGGATQQMYDDGTHGDLVAGDHVWTLTVDLMPETDMDSIHTWEWGAQDDKGNWLIEGPNLQFKMINNNPQVLTYELPEIVGEIVTAYVYFRCDMSAYEDLGIFDSALKDSVQVRGSFNGWSDADRQNCIMTRIPGTSIFELLAEVTAPVNSIQEYKYFIKLDVDHLAQLQQENPYIEDWWGWEVPATHGGGNRKFIFEGNTSQPQELPLESYMDLPFEGIIPEGHTIHVTFTMDMREAPLFNPATDTLYFRFQDKWFEHLLGYSTANGLHPDLRYQDPDEDGIYTLSFDITGKVPYYFVYTTKFVGENELEEGGGFEYGRYRCRYIQPVSLDPLTWPTEYEFPMDVFTKDPPLVVENPPLPMQKIEQVSNATPEKFELRQNYPNPFNPTTTITFSIPIKANVRINVYNMLGQIVTYMNYENINPGVYNYVWDGKDINGTPVPSGVYFYEIIVGDKFKDVRKMVLLK